MSLCSSTTELHSVMMNNEHLKAIKRRSDWKLNFRATTKNGWHTKSVPTKTRRRLHENHLS